LPFRETGEPSEKYLANAVPMELTTSLAQIDQFKTIPWTFVRELADKSRSLKDIVSSTAADAIVEGAVQLVPAVGANPERRVRITVQLYDGRTGSLIWSQPFEGDIGRFISINTRIADEIAQRIRTKLQLRREMTSPRFRSVSPDAMELYLRGRDLMRANGSPAQLQQALDYFTLATQKDASFGQAYTEVAECYDLLAGYWHKLPPQQGYPKVMEAASRAMTLDQSLASAWAARAYAKYMFRWDWRRGGFQSGPHEPR
jgi:adenylate cyclase